MLKWMKSWWSSPNEALDCFLIAGLGNPGSSYEATRHNVGFKVVRQFAKKHGFKLRKASKMSGEMAQGEIKGINVILLLPLTYMNKSGESVKKGIDAFKVPLSKMVVISDDVALPFGVLRLRDGGSAGGHNGLKSVQLHLKTEHYPRLRVGVGRPEGEALADYVLGEWTSEEKGFLPEIVDRAVSVLELWMQKEHKDAKKTT